MTARFRVESEAAAELERAAVWYERQSAGLGAEFLEAVDDSLGFVARWPHAGGFAPGVPRELQVRRVPVRRFPYHVVYLEHQGLTRILAFAHDRRSPEYWESRAPK